MYFLLQCDDSTGLSDTAQLFVFIRMIFKDFTSKEKLLWILCNYFERKN